MRVLYVNHTARVSGGERSLLDLLGGLSSAVEPVLASPAGELAALASQQGVELHVVPGTAGSLRLHPRHTPRAALDMAVGARSLRSLVRRSAPTLIHANSIRAGVIAGLGRAAGGPPVIVHVRDCLPAGAASDAVLRFIGRQSAVLLANSRYTATRLSRVEPRAPVRVIHSPVDARRFDPARTVSAPLSARNGELVLGLVAQITPWKGQLEAVEAVAHLRESGVSARLVLVGATTFVDPATRFDNRSYLAALQARIAELGLDRQVSLLGARDDVPGLMAAFDIVLVPSWEEPMGRTVLEAMAMERPVLATSVGGPAEIVEHGETGLLLEPRQPRLWAEAIAELAGDPDRRLRMGKRARRLVLERFAVENHARLVEDLYREVADGIESGL